MTDSFRVLASGFILLLAVISSLTPAAERNHVITIDDYFTQASIGECAISPDGKQIAYSESRWRGPKETPSSDLWIVNCETKAIQRLTFEPCHDSHPHWSPDGQYLYFLSSPKREGEKLPPYDGKVQVWRIQLPSHRLEPVTRVEGGISEYRLSANGGAIYYTISREHKIDE